jgi:3-hydroxymyristoyl/3-hydroxydecanoyl-(acyl carrier protein) dehydratase
VSGSWLQRLPHQIPFRAASDVERRTDDTIEGSFLVTANDALGAGAPPVDILLIEAMAQFAGGLAFQEREGHGYLSAIDGCTIDRPIQPGEVVRITVTMEAAFGAIYRFRGAGVVDGVEVVRGRFYLAEPPEDT